MAVPHERDVQAIARQIAAAGAAARSRVFHLSRWSDRVLSWAMAHPRFKTGLFRFVDVFPACRDDADVLRHLTEYFEGMLLPRFLGAGLSVAEHLPFGALLSAGAARRNVLRMARQFIAGATPDEALPQLGHLWKVGEACTVDVLGERTLTQRDADRYAARIAALLDTLLPATRGWPHQPQLDHDPGGMVPRVNISVKPSALSPLFGPLTRIQGLAEAKERLHPILERAREEQATVNLDTEYGDVKDLTFELLREIGAAFPDGPPLGCVVQAYRKDAYADLCDLVAWSERALRIPLIIRLVKGAYWDHETIAARAEGWPVPVFEVKAETDANYERCVRYLVEQADRVRPAFGSHNPRSIAYAIACARTHGVRDDAIEIQLLYGMAEPVHSALRQLGLRVRAYTPIGDLVDGMAYLVRRLLENTSNESFIHQRFAEGQVLDKLIVPPGINALPEANHDEPERKPTDPARPTPFANEPHAELRRAEPRSRLAAAVSRVRSTFDAPVFIDGQPVPTGDVIMSVDPGALSRVVCRSGRAGAVEAERAIDVALRTSPSWRSTPWQERVAVIFRAAAIMRRRRAELAALEVFEAGKPQPEADADVCEAIDFCEYYGREALRLSAGQPANEPPGETNAYRYQPRGIGAVIAPWNFPLAIPTGMVAAALVTGNCVLFKPAEQTPGTGFRLVEMLLEAGLPPGALAFLPGTGEEVGTFLVQHPAMAFVAFTGSKAVGLSIVQRAGVQQPGQRQVKRVIAEMGGKNAIVIDTDADLDQAIPATVASAFAYAGQKCSAAARVIAIGPILDELLERLRGAAAIVPLGHPSELGTVVGPLIDENAWHRVSRYQELGQKEGNVILQRDDLPDGGWYAGPTLVLIDNPRSSVATDEIFGPVLSIMHAHNFDHAISLANDTEYALTAGLFSRSPNRIRHAADELRAGNIYINRAITGARVARQPFGGYGLSGTGGKAGGPDYLLQFVEPQVVTENTVRKGFAALQSCDGRPWCGRS